MRKKLTPGDVAKSRLRVPGPLFELLFGQSAKVVLQAAPTGIGHFIAASAAQERKGYLLQVRFRLVLSVWAAKALSSSRNQRHPTSPPCWGVLGAC